MFAGKQTFSQREYRGTLGAVVYCFTLYNLPQIAKPNKKRVSLPFF